MKQPKVASSGVSFCAALPSAFPGSVSCRKSIVSRKPLIVNLVAEVGDFLSACLPMLTRYPLYYKPDPWWNTVPPMTWIDEFLVVFPLRASPRCPSRSRKSQQAAFLLVCNLWPRLNEKPGAFIMSKHPAGETGFSAARLSRRTPTARLNELIVFAMPTATPMFSETSTLGKPRWAKAPVPLVVLLREPQNQPHCGRCRGTFLADFVQRLTSV